ncbi:MAG: fumarate hydratase [Petrotogaceae bacterium]|jgi:fumarate hydratase subunit alpha|nr:fumarate hydratase [Petrotogaceae bacterium]
MISKELIKKLFIQELIKTNNLMSDDVKRHLESYDGRFSSILKENCIIAGEKGLPLCQDTGMVEIFAYVGTKTIIHEPLQNILDEAVKETYISNPYRYSTVADPLFDRKNQKNNTPCIVHTELTDGDSITLKYIVKGGGSENLSALFMLKPSAGPEEVISTVLTHIENNGARGCPPLNIGIGLGGTSDKAMVMAKLCLTEPFEKRNPDPRYADLEMTILSKINDLKIGYQGLGQGISAYSVHIKECPTHIATLPLAIAADCYLSRKGSLCIGGGQNDQA